MSLKKKTDEPVVSSMQEKDGEVSTVLVEKTLSCLLKVFGIGKEYSLTGFKKKGSSITIGLSSVDYDIAVTIKDIVRSGIVDPSEDDFD